MRYLIGSLLIFICIGAKAGNSTCSLNVVSVKYSEAKSSILLWQSVGGFWGDEQVPYETKGFISNVVSSIDRNDQPLIVWLEVGDSDNRLMSISKDAYSEWTSPTVILSSKSELTSPAIIRASDSTVYLSWVSDARGNDDVYFARFIESEWSSPVGVNAKNKVPDILPSLSIDNDGSVGLSWRAFKDPLIGYEEKFISLTSALTADGMQQVLSRQCVYDRSSIKLPESSEPLFVNYHQDVFFSFERVQY